VLPIPWFWGTQKKRLHAERLTSKAKLLIEKSKFDEALALLAKARKLSPKSIEVEYFCGIVALDLGKPADALSAFERVTSSDPNHARAHNNRGSALLLLGRMPEAEACFCKALAIDPKLSPPRVNLVHLWQRDGRREQAARLCSDAIEAGIDVPVFRHHLAAIEGIALGRADDAWVRSTFDNFAHGFDHVLQDSLGYKVPSQLAKTSGYWTWVVEPGLSGPPWPETGIAFPVLICRKKCLTWRAPRMFTTHSSLAKFMGICRDAPMRRSTLWLRQMS
jgi:Tfp pilus assembly protein PilF